MGAGELLKWENRERPEPQLGGSSSERRGEQDGPKGVAAEASPPGCAVPTVRGWGLDPTCMRGSRRRVGPGW